MFSGSSRRRGVARINGAISGIFPRGEIPHVAALMRATCPPRPNRPLSMRVRTAWILASPDDGIYFGREAGFPIWPIADVVGVVELKTSGQRHVLRVSCRP